MIRKTPLSRLHKLPQRRDSREHGVALGPVLSSRRLSYQARIQLLWPHLGEYHVILWSLVGPVRGFTLKANWLGLVSIVLGSILLLVWASLWSTYGMLTLPQ